MMALQEHSLYEDSTRRGGVYDKQIDANQMYLDLKRHKTHILSTPDVSVFALSTPEVHNLLSSAGGNSTSVTSVNLQPSPLRTFQHHPVTMEQEFYARGFLERLEALQAGEVHNKNIPEPTNQSSMLNYTSSFATGSNPSLEAVAPTYVTATLNHIPNFATTTQTTSESTASFPVSSQHDTYYSTESYALPYPRHETAMMSSYPMLTSTVAQPMYGVMESHVGHDVLKEMSMVPDLKTQEHMKVERKKARNRIAASKCRTRRLQRESDLESKVKILKDHNKDLYEEVNGLRDQISSLKKALTRHVHTGCQINVTQSESS